jgi:hypothetical protein
VLCGRMVAGETSSAGVLTGVCSITDDEPEREALESAVRHTSKRRQFVGSCISASRAIFRADSHSREADIFGKGDSGGLRLRRTDWRAPSVD